MLILLSPSKKLDAKKTQIEHPTQIEFGQETHQLVDIMKTKSVKDLKALMGISEKLATLNKDRYENFDPRQYRPENSNPAIYEFKGDVFTGLDAHTLNKEDLSFAQDHLRILSGLYGFLRPKDLIQPYRLEMGTKLPVNGCKNLYDFWKDKLTKKIQDSLNEMDTESLIYNLASNEYAEAVDFAALDARIVNFTFREWRKNKWSFISFNAKKARGLMARYIVKERITNTDNLKGFDLDGYQFVEDKSSSESLFFGRP